MGYREDRRDGQRSQGGKDDTINRQTPPIDQSHTHTHTTPSPLLPPKNRAASFKHNNKTICTTTMSYSIYSCQHTHTHPTPHTGTPTKKKKKEKKNAPQNHPLPPPPLRTRAVPNTAKKKKERKKPTCIIGMDTVYTAPPARLLYISHVGVAATTPGPGVHAGFAGAAGALAAPPLGAASTSLATTRPPGPVPARADRSMPLAPASFLASPDATTRPSDAAADPPGGWGGRRGGHGG